jgi:glutaconate CoA-transferase, subunit B
MVKRQTGFEPVVPSTLPTTDPPTDDELRVLRTRVDLEGRLRR